MLEKSIELNSAIIAPWYQKLKVVLYITFWVWMFFYFGFTSERASLYLPTVIVTSIGSGIATGIHMGMFRRIFHQSLFGEEAYTYMLFPLSSKSIVWGKTISALYPLLWSLLILGGMWVFVYLWWRDLDYGVVPWDLRVVESLTKDLMSIGQFLFQCNFGAGAVTFLIGSSILQIILCAVVLCSGVQLSAILNQLHNPNGKKNYVGVLLGLALVGIIAACLVLPTKIFCLISDGIITVLPLVITMGLEILLIVLCMKLSVWLLQTKYALN